MYTFDAVQYTLGQCHCHDQYREHRQPEGTHSGALGHCQLYIERAQTTSQTGAHWGIVYCTCRGHLQPAGDGGSWAHRERTDNHILSACLHTDTVLTRIQYRIHESPKVKAKAVEDTHICPWWFVSPFHHLC